jgi:hypothetical protein
MGSESKSTKPVATQYNFPISIAAKKMYFYRKQRGSLNYSPPDRAQKSNSWQKKNPFSEKSSIGSLI